MIKYRVMQNASMGDDIYGKVVQIIGGIGRARGTVGETDSGDDSSDLEDAIKPKDKA